MNIKNLTQMVVKVFYSVTNVIVWIGYIALALIVLTVFIDVGGRYLLNKPLTGAYDLVILAMTVLGGLAIMYTTVKRGHVGVDLLVVRFSKRAQIIMQIITSLLGVAVWAVLTYEAYLRAMVIMKSSLTMAILHVSPGPFLIAAIVGVFLSCIASLIQAFNPEGMQQKPEGDEKGFSE
ncbi:MAG: TRAP transporter small permease [Chloroflexota bacterium]